MSNDVNEYYMNRIFNDNGIVNDRISVDDFVPFEFDNDSFGIKFDNQVNVDITTGLGMSVCCYVRVKYVEFVPNEFGGKLVLYKSERLDGYMYKCGVIDLYGVKDQNMIVEFY